MSGRPDMGGDSLERVLDRCREQGMRRTRALEGILAILIRSGTPLTYQSLADAMKALCDRATVYRLLVRLEEKGLVRRLGFHQRSSHYALRFPDRHDDYLICTECGSIGTLDLGCPVEAMELEVSRRSGYRKLYHELEFFGVCPSCSAAPPIASSNSI